jgi:hypothetical protein
MVEDVGEIIRELHRRAGLTEGELGMLGFGGGEIVREPEDA